MDGIIKDFHDLKETYVLQIPQGQGRPYAADMWYEEVKLDVYKRQTLKIQSISCISLEGTDSAFA